MKKEKKMSFPRRGQTKTRRLFFRFLLRKFRNAEELVGSFYSACPAQAYNSRHWNPLPVIRTERGIRKKAGACPFVNDRDFFFFFCPPPSLSLFLFSLSPPHFRSLPVRVHDLRDERVRRIPRDAADDSRGRRGGRGPELQHSGAAREGRGDSARRRRRRSRSCRSCSRVSSASGPGPRHRLRGRHPPPVPGECQARDSWGVGIGSGSGISVARG